MGWFPEQEGGPLLLRLHTLHAASWVEIRGLVAGSVSILHDSTSQIEAFAPLNSSLAQSWRGARQAVHRC